MVKSERQTKEKEFLPISLIIESQKELDFIVGLFNGGEGERKEDCNDYTEALDEMFWNEMVKWT